MPGQTVADRMSEHLLEDGDLLVIEVMPTDVVAL
jgi:hypothetical protein